MLKNFDSKNLSPWRCWAKFAIWKCRLNAQHLSGKCKREKRTLILLRGNDSLSNIGKNCCLLHRKKTRPLRFTKLIPCYFSNTQDHQKTGTIGETKKSKIMVRFFLTSWAHFGIQKLKIEENLELLCMKKEERIDLRCRRKNCSTAKFRDWINWTSQKSWH